MQIELDEKQVRLLRRPSPEGRLARLLGLYGAEIMEAAPEVYHVPEPGSWAPKNADAPRLGDPLGPGPAADPGPPRGDDA